MNFESLGINTGLVVAMMAIIEVIKEVDKKNVLEKLYVLFPILLSIGVSFLVTRPIEWQMYFTNLVIYAGVTSYLYSILKKTGFIDKFKKMIGLVEQTPPTDKKEG